MSGKRPSSLVAINTPKGAQKEITFDAELNEVCFY
jgi:hypothetical protein